MRGDAHHLTPLQAAMDAQPGAFVSGSLLHVQWNRIPTDADGYRPCPCGAHKPYRATGVPIKCCPGCYGVYIGRIQNRMKKIVKLLNEEAWTDGK